MGFQTAEAVTHCRGGDPDSNVSCGLDDYEFFKVKRSPVMIARVMVTFNQVLGEICLYC
jgi:hypothetical protein